MRLHMISTTVFLVFPPCHYAMRVEIAFSRFHVGGCAFGLWALGFRFFPIIATSLQVSPHSSIAWNCCVHDPPIAISKVYFLALCGLSETPSMLIPSGKLLPAQVSLCWTCID